MSFERHDFTNGFLTEFINPRYTEEIEALDINPRYDVTVPIPQDPTQYGPRSFYNGNKKIKKAGCPVMMTPEMREEFTKCKNDILYFAERYFYIRTLDDGRIKIPLRDYQKQMLRALESPLWREYAFLASRQSAKSTTLTIRVLHNLLFKKDFEQAIVAQVGGTAREIFGRVAMAYEELPLWIQGGSVEWNKGSVTLESGSKVFAGSSSSNSLRGFSLNELFIDETAFITGADEFFKSVLPVISSGKSTKVVMTTTPNGKKGHFYRNFSRAIQGKNSYFTMGIPWWMVPGRDEAWKKREMENSTYEDFEQEYNIRFLSSALALVASKVIERIEIEDIEDPLEVIEGVNVYAKPRRDTQYIMIVDTAEGKELDYSTFTIWSIGVRIAQVAVYQSNKIAPIPFAAFTARWADHYNTAKMVIENNNASGSLVAYSVFMEQEYDDVYCQHQKNETGIGVRTTTKVKSSGCNLLNALLRSDRFHIRDHTSLTELMNFEAKGNSYAAAEGSHDDLVQNMWLLAWFTSQPEYEEYELEGGNTVHDAYKEDMDAIEAMSLDGNNDSFGTDDEEMNRNSTAFW